MDRGEVEVHKNVKKRARLISSHLGLALGQQYMLEAKVKARFGFLFFYLLPDREITENIFTATENVLRKKTFMHPLGSDNTTTMTKTNNRVA